MPCGSGRSLVEFWGSDTLLYILLEVCPAYKDKVEIKCMGPVGGKTPTEPKIHFSQTLGTLNKIKLF
jgi:hypothetical protein